MTNKKSAKFLLLATLFAAGFSHPARAEEAAPVPVSVPDLSTCTALSDEKSYENDFDGLIYLVQGKDGWLFRTKQDLRAEYEMSEEATPDFQILTKALRKKGTEFVIALAPTRGMAAHDLLPMSNPLVKDYKVEDVKKSYTDFIAAMNTAGIPTVGTPDLKAGANYFYKTDLHWTTEGAREMAEAVATYIKALPVYAGLKKTEFVMTPAPDGEFEGNFTEAIEKLCNAKMPLEKATQIVVEPKKAEGDEQAALLGDQAEPEVVLVGTSNSDRDDFDMNFSGSLKEFLGADLKNRAIAGGGLDDSILAYLSSEDFRKNPPKVLIWEVPGYYNLHGDAAKKALKQLIPAVHGDCGASAIADSGELAINSDKVPLFDAAALEKVRGKEFYLALSLDQPTQKGFSVQLDKSDNKNQKAKFSSSRNPDNKSFFYALESSETVVFTDAVLNAPKEMQGKKITARLCPLEDTPSP